MPNIHKRNWKVVAFTTSGDTTLVAAVTGKVILLKSAIFTVDAETDVYLGWPSNQLTCTFQFPGGGGFVSSNINFDILIPEGKALIVNSSNAVTGSIMVDYQIFKT